MELQDIINGKYPNSFVNSEKGKCDFRRVVALLRDHFIRINDSYIESLQAKLSQSEAEKAELVRAAHISAVKQCAATVMDVYGNPTAEELGTIYDCRDRVLALLPKENSDE